MNPHRLWTVNGHVELGTHNGSLRSHRCSTLSGCPGPRLHPGEAGQRASGSCKSKVQPLRPSPLKWRRTGHQVTEKTSSGVPFGLNLTVVGFRTDSQAPPMSDIRVAGAIAVYMAARMVIGAG